MKKILFSMLVCSLALMGCNGVGKVQDGEPKAADFESDSACTTVADAADTGNMEEAKEEEDPTKAPLPATLDDALPPKGKISTMLPQFTSSGGYRMFEIDGTKGTFTDQDGETAIYLLRLVCYVVTDKQSEKREDGGRVDSEEGRLVVDAFNPKTKAFAGRYDGTYSMVADFDAEGEFEHGGEGYEGTFTDANGKKKEFTFFGD